jgi:hypothetical protein
MMGLLFLLWIGCGVVAAAIAAEKHRDGCLFFILGVIIGPFAVLGAAMMSTDAKRAQQSAVRRGALVPCPHCRTPVDPRATVCPACRSPLAPPAPAPKQPDPFDQT